MVPIPKVAPGDMVFWHCDTIHRQVRRALGEQRVPDATWAVCRCGSEQDRSPSRALKLLALHDLSLPDLSVESVHRGTEDASVFFIPAAPMCDLNRDYLRKQAETLRRGITPPDFPGNDSEVSFRHRATPDLLSPLGREMMGL